MPLFRQKILKNRPADSFPLFFLGKLLGSHGGDGHCLAPTKEESSPAEPATGRSSWSGVACELTCLKEVVSLP
ncbi:hypothetical protein JCGZ_03186 [Jatropha curcas]|uniref:Uncharacterized protein n=1 Tax=Jatropha curcas TaxID=180498 RepID=A0A067JGP2_JATCU|nr:hypothetical protein JCGZ_03186 [Jatropha curcas]